MEGNAESDLLSIEVKKVILPKGQVMTNVHLDKESTVREEKEKILILADIPDPILYVMVVQGPKGSRDVLDDSRTVESYVDVIAGGGHEWEIYIERRNAQVDCPPGSANTDLFNVNLSSQVVHIVQVFISDENMEGNPEADMLDITVARVVLPDGRVKENVHLDIELNVGQEKETILRAAGIPNPIDYVMVVQGPDGSKKVLDDSQTVESYADVIARGAEYEIYIAKKTAQADCPPGPVNTELLNVNVK